MRSHKPPKELVEAAKKNIPSSSSPPKGAIEGIIGKMVQQLFLEMEAFTSMHKQHLAGDPGGLTPARSLIALKLTFQDEADRFLSATAKMTDGALERRQRHTRTMTRRMLAIIRQLELPVVEDSDDIKVYDRKPVIQMVSEFLRWLKAVDRVMDSQRSKNDQNKSFREYMDEADGPSTSRAA